MIHRIQALLTERRNLLREKHALKCEMDYAVDPIRYLECRGRLGFIRDRCDIIMEQIRRGVDEIAAQT
jgi:hypothetical protein